MTTYQLRDICWREQIINGIQAPLDKDELIRQIMRFRGRKKAAIDPIAVAVRITGRAVNCHASHLTMYFNTFWR